MLYLAELRPPQTKGPPAAWLTGVRKASSGGRAPARHARDGPRGRRWEWKGAKPDMGLGYGRGRARSTVANGRSRVRVRLGRRDQAWSATGSDRRARRNRIEAGPGRFQMSLAGRQSGSVDPFVLA